MEEKTHVTSGSLLHESRLVISLDLLSSSSWFLDDRLLSTENNGKKKNRQPINYTFFDLNTEGLGSPTTEIRRPIKSQCDVSRLLSNSFHSWLNTFNPRKKSKKTSHDVKRLRVQVLAHYIIQPEPTHPWLLLLFFYRLVWLGRLLKEKASTCFWFDVEIKIDLIFWKRKEELGN